MTPRDEYLAAWERWQAEPAGVVRLDFAGFVLDHAKSLRAKPGRVEVLLGCPAPAVAWLRHYMLAYGGLAPEFTSATRLRVWVEHEADVTLAMYGKGGPSVFSIAVRCAELGVDFPETFGRMFGPDVCAKHWGPAQRYATIRAQSRAVVG